PASTPATSRSDSTQRAHQRRQLRHRQGRHAQPHSARQRHLDVRDRPCLRGRRRLDRHRHQRRRATLPVHELRIRQPPRTAPGRRRLSTRPPRRYPLRPHRRLALHDALLFEKERGSQQVSCTGGRWGGRTLTPLVPPWANEDPPAPPPIPPKPDPTPPTEDTPDDEVAEP